ncbi:hypothetical protein COBT_000684, partial [Conglomerata obtusa]
MAKKSCKWCLMPYRRLGKTQNGLKCNMRRCKKLKSSATIFTKKPFLASKLNFSFIIEVLYLFFIGINNKQVKMLTGVSKPTIKKIIKSSLERIKRYIKNNPKILGGNDVIVEGDESLFGRIKYNRGRRRNQIWVVGF